MRGAVLYKLGLDYVKDRVLRLSYGIQTNVLFRRDYHPVARRYVDFSGQLRCRGYMRWYAKRVLSAISLSDS
jgi:hypothetical protein